RDDPRSAHPVSRRKAAQEQLYQRGLLAAGQVRLPETKHELEQLASVGGSGYGSHVRLVAAKRVLDWLPRKSEQEPGEEDEDPHDPLPNTKLHFVRQRKAQKEADHDEREQQRNTAELHFPWPFSSAAER